ncbi:MAG: helix-turn-helix domain-containing protein [Planctomycetes bacterium]|nr:helix-turn-helix domain-containing protein [Planctomycetota bacterium]
MGAEAPLVAELINFGCHVYPSQAQRWDTHLHGFHQLDVTVAGEVWLEVEGGKPFHSRRGDAVLVPPLIRHAHRTRRGMTIGMFKFRAAPRYWALLGRRPRGLRLPEGLVAQVEDAGRAMREHAALARPQALAALTLCLVETVRRAGAAVPAAADPAAGRFWRVLERVETEPFGSWSVAKLAGECHLSPDHFARSFHALLGQPPREYLLGLRMRAAAQVLSDEPEVAIKHLAEQAGYATVHAFARAFRRVLGAPPGAYRRARSEL